MRDILTFRIDRDLAQAVDPDTLAFAELGNPADFSAKPHKVTELEEEDVSRVDDDDTLAFVDPVEFDEFPAELDADEASEEHGVPPSEQEGRRKPKPMSETELNDKLALMGFDPTFSEKRNMVHWVDHLLRLLRASPAQIAEIGEFHTEIKDQIKEGKYGESITDITGYKDIEEERWDTNDPAMDQLWDEMVALIQEIVTGSFLSSL